MKLTSPAALVVEREVGLSPLADAGVGAIVSVPVTEAAAEHEFADLVSEYVRRHFEEQGRADDLHPQPIHTHIIGIEFFDGPSYWRYPTIEELWAIEDRDFRCCAIMEALKGLELYDAKTGERNEELAALIRSVIDARAPTAVAGLFLQARLQGPPVPIRSTGRCWWVHKRNWPEPTGNLFEAFGISLKSEGEQS